MWVECICRINLKHINYLYRSLFLHKGVRLNVVSQFHIVTSGLVSTSIGASRNTCLGFPQGHSSRYRMNMRDDFLPFSDRLTHLIVTFDTLWIRTHHLFTPCLIFDDATSRTSLQVYTLSTDWSTEQARAKSLESFSMEIDVTHDFIPSRCCFIL